MKTLLKYCVGAFFAFAAAACGKDEFGVPVYYRTGNRYAADGTADREIVENPWRAFLIYSAGYNNLSSYLREDIDDVCADYVPRRFFDDRLLVFAQHSNSASAASPCLINIYRDSGGNVVRDTVKRWSSDVRAVDPETITMVLNYVRENFPSGEYGMLFSSHATGWLPESDDASILNASSRPQRSIGADSATGEELDIKEFAAAIPMELEYIIFDACLTGGIEVAYELKDKCKHLLFSSSEIWADGIVYYSLASRVLGEKPPNLVGAAEDFYEYYNTHSSLPHYATISVVNCAALENLARVCAPIISNHRSELSYLNASDVQATNRTFSYRRRYSYYYFYDFRDIFAQLSLSEEEKTALDNALEACIEYKANTEYIFGGIKMESYSGLSMYLPSAISLSALRAGLNNYYLDYQWNIDSGYIPGN